MAAYVVSQGTRDAGIRMALGASPAAVVRSLFGRLALVLAAASAAGLLLAAAAAGVVGNVVFQASTRDPLILAASAAAIGVVGLLAAAHPARRAVSIDPLRAVRGD
jgi:ABC-type antimicrobial peptide transport system permease subunit